MQTLRVSAIPLAALILATQTATLAEKQAALHQPVCLIPMDQRIELADLPQDTIRLDWMRGLKSSLPVSMVSIPATHDAGTALARFGGTRCQVLSIPAQLAIGMRGFDVRLRRVHGVLGVYHSVESQKLDFESVLTAFSSFLAGHPHELIVMRVREEADPLDTTESFEDCFRRYTEPYRGLFFKAKSRTEIPTVGQLRGKILVLDNFGKLADAVAYPNAAMGVQDDYDTSDMAKKLSEIEAKFEDAQHQTSPAIWNVNYTSSSTDQVDQLANARAVNASVLQFLKGKKGNLGLVLMNFPSVDVVDEIIDSNF